MRKFSIFGVLAFLLVLNSSAQVNYQTGSAVFDLPVFNWTDTKSRLNLNISVNYNSGSGLKVNEVASEIGQGWSLMAGGVISRMQVGQPDDQKPNYGNGSIEDIGKYPPGYLYNSKSPSSGCPVALTKYPIFPDKNHLYKQHNSVAADTEADYFAFQFNGRSGMFVLDLNNNGAIFFTEATEMKAWYTKNENAYQDNLRTTISEFFIQDEFGLIYKFSQKERTKVLRYNFCDANFTAQQTQPNFKPHRVYHEYSFDDPTIPNPYIVNSWYLSEIRDPLTQRTITFNYVLRNVDAYSGASFSHFLNDNYSIVSHARSVTQTPQLESVVLPDDHLVAFNYNKPRVDLNGSYALGAIDVKYGARFLSKFQFNTTYFLLNRYGTPGSDYQKKVARLCLKSIVKYGPDLKDAEEPYAFDYYLGSDNVYDVVPPAFSTLKDNFGYFNGDASKGVDNSIIPVEKSIFDLSNDQLKGLCFVRNGETESAHTVKTGYAKNGLLKQILYPTGGAITYEYEQNESVLNGTVKEVGGVHVSRSLVTDGGESNGCDNPIITSYNYTQENGITSSLWGVENPVHRMVSGSYYKPEDKYFYLRPVLSMGCDYRIQHPGIVSREQAVSLTSSQKFMQTFSKIMDVVGGILTVVDIVKVSLTAAPPHVLAVVIDIIVTAAVIAITCFINPESDESITTCFNSSLTEANPLPAQFKRVEVIQGDGSAGKTVMEFTSPDDYALWVPSNPTFSMVQRFSMAAYGQLKRKTLFSGGSGGGKKVQEIENTYDFNYARVGGFKSYIAPSAKCLVQKTSSQRYDQWSDPLVYETAPGAYTTVDNNDLAVSIYGIYSSNVVLDSSVERIYKDNGLDYLKTVTRYGYQFWRPFYVHRTNSNGEITLETTTYSGATNGGVYDVFQSNNVLWIPVAKQKYVGNQMIHEEVNDWTQLPGGDVKTSRILERRFSEPTTTYNVFTGASSLGSNNYVTAKNFLYDDEENLVGITDEGARAVTNIYDYNNRYIVASVVNATFGVDHCSYTSFESGTTGGWTLVGPLSYNNTQSVTGKFSFNLGSANTLFAYKNSEKDYVLSFWGNTGGSFSVSSGTLLSSGPTLGGMSLHVYKVSTGEHKVEINGSGVIDEVRFHPADARMKTVTYDPVVGKTSECDETNRITYYEYDSFGRLLYIKDENKNLVKYFEFNNVSRTSACPVTYYNKAVSEVFQKKDCGPDFVGSFVTYQIPAEKYSSTESQEMADAFAQYELDMEGQNYADQNGTCLPKFYNVQLSETFQKQGCPIGTIGTSYTYTVPAGKYFSLVGVTAANEMAQEELDANGQAMANLPGNANCVTDYNPVWVGTGYEECVNGNKMVQVRDMNPNSSSYYTTQMVHFAEDQSCPPPTSSCYMYKVIVPFHVAGNLYIEYYDCNGSWVSALWDSLPQDLEEDSYSSSIIICSQYQPYFKYGFSGPAQEIPEIIVDLLGSCN